MKKFFVILVALAVVALAAPVMASEQPGPSFVVGGRILTDLGYHKTSKELTTNGKEDVSTVFVNVAGHSYLNAKFTSADKSTGGFIELGLSSKVGNSEGVSLRYAYGWWKVGNCRLMAGHDDGWIGSLAFAPRQYLGLSEAAKLLMSNWGYTYSGRHPQVRFEWMSGNFGASLAVVQPAAEIAPSFGATTDLYAVVPRFDLAFQFKAGGFLTMPAIGWSQVKGEGVRSGGDDTMTSYLFLLPVKFTMGGFTAKAEFHYGQNNELEWNGVNSSLRTLPRSQPVIQAGTGKIEDTRMTGGFLSLEYKVNPVLQFAAGYGIEQITNDAWKKWLGYKNDDYRRQAYFVSATYDVTKNFAIHPEFNYWNYGDKIQDNKDFGNEWMLGVQFRFVF